MYTGECTITIRYADKRRIPSVVREIAESLERDQVRQDSSEWSCSIRDYPKETPIPVAAHAACYEPAQLSRYEAPGVAATDVAGGTS